MIKNQRVHDIAIRFPKEKKHLKKKLLAIAKRNSMTMTQVVIIVIESFLALPEKTITIKLK